MSFDYLSVIKPFALQAFDPFNPPATPWQLDAFRVARSLLRLLDNPDAIAQACFGTCGQVAFLRAWACRDPVAVARFTLELYAKGSAKIGDYAVGASGDHLQSKWMKIPLLPDVSVYDAGKWGVGNRITESVWMVCGALAATEDGTFEHSTLGHNIPPIPVPKFNGQPASDLSTLTLPGELKRWLDKTGCYAGGVEDRTSTVGGKSLADDSVVTSDFDDSVDVFLCINVNLFAHASFTPSHAPVAAGGAPLNWFPNHWVVLKDKITQSAGTVSMNIWTWGGNYTVQVALADFDANYYGSVVARAATARRSVSTAPMHNAIGAPRIYYSQDNQLHFEWLRTHNGVEWCELNRVQPGRVPTPVGGLMMKPRDTLQRRWVADGSSVCHVSLPMPDPAAAHDTLYEIAACRAALRPHDCDPSSYNFYNEVPCNLPSSFEYSLPQSPLCETQTTHLRLRYYGYPSAKQIPDGLDPYTMQVGARCDEAILFGSETIGHCFQDGRTDIVHDGATIVVGTEPRTPRSIQKIAVWFEYLCALLGSAPCALECLAGGERIEITLGDGFGVQGGASQSPRIGIDAPAADQDLPGLCLKALLALELARTGRLPEWVFPSFVSRVAIVQTPMTAQPPVGFADFGESFKACETTTVYQAQWEPTASGRLLQVDVRKPLNPSRPACVFVEFSNKDMVEANSSLVLSGQSPDGKKLRIAVPLAPSSDHRYFHGTFQPTNAWAADYTLGMTIQGTRAWPADVLRVLLGDRLDAYPATVASLDPGRAGPLAFTQYDSGGDACHRIEVGPQARYAPLASLTPDALETPVPNDSFATATRVTSLILANKPPSVGTVASVEKVFDRLNFHDRQDADFFDVSYQCPASDDTDAANRPASGGTSAVLGLSYGHRPPELSCRVTPDDFRCMDVAAYAYGSGTPVLFASDARTTGITIASPARSLGAKRCYFVLTNHDFAAAGAFFYAARFIYTSAYDSISVDTHAPAYGGKLSVRRRILERLYERIDLPRPEEDGSGVIRVQDPVAFIKAYGGFLQEPQTAALLGQSLHRNGATVVAESLHALGQVARTFGRAEEAGSLFRKSSGISLALSDKAGAIAALESLAGLYKSLGQTAEYTAVRREIGNLKRRVLPQR